MAGPVSRSWCFTSYNLPDPHNERFRYYIYQTEICPTTGRLHYQGYAECNAPMRRLAFQRYMGTPNCHCNPRRKTRDEAREYCFKENTRALEPDYILVEYGNWESGGQGRRNDILNVMSDIRQGDSQLQVMHNHPETYAQYSRFFREYRFEILREATTTFRHLHVEVLWGAAGTGKTRYCVENFPIHYKLDFDESTVWWDGYNGEETLILNDFYGNIRYHKLLDLLDGYQLRLQIKGGHTYAAWTKVLITSNKPPSEWYSQGMTDALARRIHTIRHLVDSRLELLDV